MSAVALIPAATPNMALTPIGSGPVPLHRLAFTLRFAVPAGASGIAIDAAGAAFAGTFAARVVDVPIGAGGAVLSSGAGGVIVKLPQRRQVHQFAVAAPLGPLVAGVALHRIDGASAADDPTATVFPSATSASSRTFTATQDFTDVRFVMKSTTTASPLTTGSISGLKVKGFPTGPRIGLADPAHPDTPIYFWQEPGEHTSDLAVAAGAGAALVAALQRHLDDRFAAGPIAAPVDVLLVLDSDAPAQFTFSAGPAVTFRSTARPSLPSEGSSPGKLVLRFSEQDGFVQSFPLALPATGTVASAILLTAPSFKGGAGSVGGETGGEGSGAVPPDSDRGAVLASGRWVAQRIVLESAVDLRGLVLAGYALEPDTEVRIEVRADGGRGPVGPPLVSALAAVDGTGRPSWMRGAVVDGTSLAAGPAWILATAARGSAIWLGEEGDPPALTYRSGEDGPALRESSSLPGLRCLFRLLSRAAATPLASSDAAASAPFRIEIAGTPASRAAPDPVTGRVTFDLTAALAAALPAPSGSARAVLVDVSAIAPGLLTVYTPVVQLGG